MMMSVREQFEQWAKQEMKKGVLSEASFDRVELVEDGPLEYNDCEVSVMWLAWCASRSHTVKECRFFKQITTKG
jgi:hypothetical protein